MAKAAAALALLLATSASAAFLPDPSVDPAACGRPRESRVCDPNGLLRSADALDERLAALKAKRVAWPARSPCAKAAADGVEAAVVVVSRLPSGGGPSDDDDGDALDARAAAAARGLHDAWGVGDGACSNGALLLVAVGDRRSYLSIGAGLRAGGLVSDGRGARVLARATPHLRAGDVDGAVLAALGALEAYVDAGPPSRREWLRDRGPVLLFYALVAAILGAVAVQSLRDARARADYEAAARHLSRAERVRGNPRGIPTDARYLQRARSGTNFQYSSLRSSGNYGKAFEPAGPKRPWETRSF